MGYEKFRGYEATSAVASPAAAAAGTPAVWQRDGVDSEEEECEEDDREKEKLVG